MQGRARVQRSPCVYDRYTDDVASCANMSQYGWALEDPKLYIIILWVIRDESDVEEIGFRPGGGERQLYRT